MRVEGRGYRRWEHTTVQHRKSLHCPLQPATLVFVNAGRPSKHYPGSTICLAPETLRDRAYFQARFVTCLTAGILADNEASNLCVFVFGQAGGPPILGSHPQHKSYLAVLLNILTETPRKRRGQTGRKHPGRHTAQPEVRAPIIHPPHLPTRLQTASTQIHDGTTHGPTAVHDKLRAAVVGGGEWVRRETAATSLRARRLTDTAVAAGDLPCTPDTRRSELCGLWHWRGFDRKHWDRDNVPRPPSRHPSLTPLHRSAISGGRERLKEEPSRDTNDCRY